jgi:hypothetical protein
MTDNQSARITHDWVQVAGEPVRVEQIGGAVYGFTSELGALRLYHKFRGAGRAGYSENLKTWYFSVELKFS